jgi:hypothetical protein
MNQEGSVRKSLPAYKNAPPEEDGRAFYFYRLSGAAKASDASGDSPGKFNS